MRTNLRTFLAYCESPRCWQGSQGPSTLTCASFHTIVGELGVKATLVALCLSVTCTDCWSQQGGHPGPSMPPDRPRQPDRLSFSALTDTFSSLHTIHCSCSLSYVLGTYQPHSRTDVRTQFGLHRFQLPKTRIGWRQNPGS